MNDIGEKAFLRALIPQLSARGDFVNGFGHDASIIELGLEQHVAFKIDRAPSPVAVTRGWSDHRVWGRLAVAANVSDLLAVAAQPRAVMLSITVPRGFSVQAATEIVLGCQESCEQHAVTFLGGDTKEGPSIQVVGAALGVVSKKYRLGRGRAAIGDHFVVAGQLGGFIGALQMLDSGRHAAWSREQLLRTLTNPMARIKEAAYLRQSQMASFACDVSDGLADVLSVFCGETVGLTVEASRLPMHPYSIAAAARRGVDPSAFAFGVGDWALACVVPHSSIERFLADAPAGAELSDLGQFDATGLMAIKSSDDKTRPMPVVINEQFRARLEDDSQYVDSLLDSTDESN